MRQVVFVFTTPAGIITRQLLTKPAGGAVKLSLPAGTKLDVEVHDSSQVHPVKGGVNPDLQHKQVGQSLVIEAGGKSWWKSQTSMRRLMRLWGMWFGATQSRS